MCLGACCGCVGSAFANCCCSGFKDCRKAKYGPISRIPYIFLMFLFCFFAICMTLFGEKVLWSNDLLDVSFQVCQTDTCVGNGSVYRTSFTLFLFFAIHAGLVYCVLAFHYLFFMIKITCAIAVLITTFFVPGQVFDGYAQFARVGSAFFLLIQIYVLISWAWDTNEKIVLKINEALAADVNDDVDEDSQTSPRACMLKVFLISATLALNILCIVVWVFLFVWFTAGGGGEDCSFNKAMISLTIILAVLITLLPPLLGTGSIFTTAVVAFYCTFLCYSALESSPIPECNRFIGDTNTAGMWIGIIVTTAAISYTGFSVSKTSTALSDGHMLDEDNEINMELGTKPRGTASATATAKDGDDDDDDDEAGHVQDSNYNDGERDEQPVEDRNPDFKKAETKANCIFHICMTFSSLYVAMLYTAWGTNSPNVEAGSAKARGWTSVYVNLSCIWVTVFFYGWTIIAPKMCPGRFGPATQEED